MHVGGDMKMKILTFGEVLYDIFDGDYKIGGAPLNFSAHFSKLGGCGYVLSAVGNDELGNKAINIADEIGVSTKYLFKSNYQTGFCKVTRNGDEPIYDLSAVCAYDNIEVSDDDVKAIENECFDILYFGTLVQRNAVSRNTLKKLLDRKCFKKIFFDMNLRQDYYSKEIIEKSLYVSDIVKINRDEFDKLKAFGMCKDEKELCDKYDIEKLLLTLDKDGMMLYDSKTGKTYNSQKPKNKVVSTVGAGDGSSACFLYNHLAGEDLQVCIDRANLMGDYIVTFTEAIPEYSEELLNELKNCKGKEYKE